MLANLTMSTISMNNEDGEALRANFTGGRDGEGGRWRAVPREGRCVEHWCLKPGPLRGEGPDFTLGRTQSC